MFFLYYKIILYNNQTLLEFIKRCKKFYTLMLNNVDEDEKLTYVIHNSGQNREMWFLTEDGLYEVLMQSRKPIAKAFKKEVKKILRSVLTTLDY